MKSLFTQSVYPAERTMSEFSEVKNQADQALKRTVVIDANGTTFTPSKIDIASWLILDTDQTGQPSLRVDKGKVDAYIAQMNKQVGEPAGQTDIRIINGRETGRTPGKIGRAIDGDALVTQLSQYILGGKGKPEIVAKFVDVQPSVIYNSKYTATQEGLQAYVTDTAHSKNVRIDIRQLDENGWTASARAHESIPSASTYKLFVSLMLFDKMKKGEISWNDPMLDTTVSTCFELMTIASVSYTNHLAHETIQTISY